MKKTSILILVLLALSMLSAPLIQHAKAMDNISFQFTAHVVYVDDPNDLFDGAISVGDMVTGVLTYDLDTPADIHSSYSAFYRYDTLPYGIVAIVNGLTFQTNFTDVDFHVNVVNDYTGMVGVPLYDGTVFHSFNNIFPIMLDDLYETPPPPTLTEHHISWQIDDFSGTAISSLDLPTSFDLALWEQPFGLVFHANTWVHHPDYPYPLQYFIRAVVDTIEGVPRLEDALLEIADLQRHIRALYEEGAIDDYKYDRTTARLSLAYNLTYGAIWDLDTERPGFDDLKTGMNYLYRAVRELEVLVKDIENWVNWGNMPSDLADVIVEELEGIQMKLVNKARAEAEAERMLAVAALEDAEARGRHVPWLWNQLSYIDTDLADADYWLAEGWLSKAVDYYKMAFYYAQRVVVNAWHWSWDIATNEWVDQLEASL